MARDVYEDFDEIQAEAGKDRVADGLVIVTTLLLLLGLFMIQRALADHFQAGMLADKQNTAPSPE